MEKHLIYDPPTIVDYGSLADVTAHQQVGGPVDTFAYQPPGHSCPTGSPINGQNPEAGEAECNGTGSEEGEHENPGHT
jgi:hypothetical protein